MAWCLIDRTAQPPPGRDQRWMKRFAAACWTVNFPRPMVASVVTTGADALRIDAVFYRKQDLCGVIWDSEDRLSHPLCAYETARDYRHTSLRFRWRSGGIRPLDAVHGPTLTIEGRDESGAARSWYVRLWNYATGSPDDAVISLDFDALAGGFLHPAEADPLWAGDIDRMFISMVPPAYDGSSGDLAAPEHGWAIISDLAASGSGSMIRTGDAMVPPHGLSIATGYDDLCNQTPERIIRTLHALGDRGDITHYVGMSHFPVLSREAGQWRASSTGGPAGTPAINPASAAWHADFAARANAEGLGINWSLSYELFDAYCPDAWKQRASDGSPAQTGWTPPSTLLSPACGPAMAWLQAVAVDLVTLAKNAGLPVRFQIGEPWWWIMPDGRPCLYDAATSAALGPASVALPTVRAPLNAAQMAMLDACGALLASSTAALASAVRNAAGAAGATVLLLVYLPGSFAADAPELARANCPVGWAWPAYDVLQSEDYEWVTGGGPGGRAGDRARAAAAIDARLGYPLAAQNYMAGFVLNSADKAQWQAIDAAAEAARARGFPATIIWAYPQICRDGFVHFGPNMQESEDGMTPIDDVLFPLAIGREALVSTEFATQIAASPSGHETRMAEWADARMAYDAGPGVVSEQDVATLTAFFRDRRGAARGFRFRDPFDASSAGGEGTPTPLDQRIGTGDGVQTRFALVRAYGDAQHGPPQLRRITRPVAQSVLIAVGGVPQANGPAGGWTLAPLGHIDFAVPPPAGAAITAGFRFDVPVRFASDRLEVSRATFAAGEVPSVPLIELREG